MNFHVHTYASQFTLEAIFAHNPIGKFDQPVMYASRLLNLDEKNYIIIERGALAILVYTIHKFKHYLLGNQFVFYVNHMALVSYMALVS